MPTYRVTWEIDIDEATPRKAAARAQRIMLDPDSIATVFKVEDKRDVHVIDLLEEEDCVTDDERSNGPKKTGGKHERQKR